MKVRDNNSDELKELKRQIHLLEEELGQSNRIRWQWHEASRKLTISQHALRKREALYRQVTDNAFDAIILAGRDGLILEANQAASGIFGYAPEAWKGMEIKTLIPEYLRKKHEDRFHHHIETGEHHIIGTIVKTEALHRDGHIFPIELIISRLDQGKARVMATIRDMTEEKAMEEQFRQAQKMEALGTMVGGIAHEFNNMLAGMTGNLYLARSRFDLDPALRKKIDKVETLAFNAAAMIKQLLAFSRKDCMTMQKLSLVLFCKEVFRMCRASVPATVDLQLRVGRDEIFVHGDATLLQQVLVNLIHNAKDAVEGVDSPCVKVDLKKIKCDSAFAEKHKDLHAEYFAHLSVSDNGCGIDKKQMEHIFEPFYTSKPVGKGTGLGLSMAYGTVQSHGGEIEVDSEPGRGTKFHIYLPLMEDDVSPSALSDSEEDIFYGHGETILLVDDDKGVLDTGQEVLVSLGYKVLTASNGQDAVDIIQAMGSGVDLVILDVVMPKLGGVAASHQMHRIRPDIRTLFATAYHETDKADPLLAGTKGSVLSKPFSVKELSRAIKEMLSDAA